MTRKINLIQIHCSATREGVNVTAAMVDQWHKAQGWSGIGYNFFIRLDGTIEEGRPLDKAPAGVFGHNANAIAICYAGGLNGQGAPKDTRTPEQKASLASLVRKLAREHGVAVHRILGHRDLSPDKNKDGKISEWEWLKACPSFDVPSERAGWLA